MNKLEGTDVISPYINIGNNLVSHLIENIEDDPISHHSNIVENGLISHLYNLADYSAEDNSMSYFIEYISKFIDKIDLLTILKDHYGEDLFFKAILDSVLLRL